MRTGCFAHDELSCFVDSLFVDRRPLKSVVLRVTCACTCACTCHMFTCTCACTCTCSRFTVDGSPTTCRTRRTICYLRLSKVARSKVVLQVLTTGSESSPALSPTMSNSSRGHVSLGAAHQSRKDHQCTLFLPRRRSSILDRRCAHERCLAERRDRWRPRPTPLTPFLHVTRDTCVV